MSYPSIEIEKNQARELGILRPAGRNELVQFKLKVEQDLHLTTQTGKSTEAVIKQFAGQELQDEKAEIER